MYYRFSCFIKFWFTERNTKNTMSHLHFNEESDYSEESSTILHHWKKLNISTLQLPIY